MGLLQPSQIVVQRNFSLSLANNPAVGHVWHTCLAPPLETRRCLLISRSSPLEIAANPFTLAVKSKPSSSSSESPAKSTGSCALALSFWVSPAPDLALLVPFVVLVVLVVERGGAEELVPCGPWWLVFLVVVSTARMSAACVGLAAPLLICKPEELEELDTKGGAEGAIGLSSPTACFLDPGGWATCFRLLSVVVGWSVITGNGATDVVCSITSTSSSSSSSTWSRKSSCSWCCSSCVNRECGGTYGSGI